MRFPSASFRRQQGVALLVGLIMLLVLTILGVTAIRTTTQQGTMSAAVQQQTQTFQAAEAAIRSFMVQFCGGGTCEQPPPDGGAQILARAISNSFQVKPPAPATQTPTLGSGLNASANLLYLRKIAAEGSSFNKSAFYEFTITSTATQQNTGAQATHLQGIRFIGPDSGS